jgi:hypothetical protein
MMQFTKIRIFAPAAILLAFFASSVRCAEPTAPTDVARLIEQLRSPDYSVREAASRQLLAAGSEAVNQLAKAAQSDDAEASFRAIGILQSFADGNDGKCKPPAVDALRSLAVSENPGVAAAADNALAMDRVARRAAAIEKLRELKAIVSIDPSFDLNTVTIDSNWTGKTDDLELLKFVPNLQRLQIINVPLDDGALKTLGSLDSLRGLELFGTGVSTDATQQLSHDLPGTTILRRAGGLLGVRGNGGMGNCTITEVQPDSAASQAGLQSGDEIVRFNDQEVHSFEELTGLIGQRNSGEKITLEIHRKDESFTKEVTLGQWKYSEGTFGPRIQIQNLPRPLPQNFQIIPR